MNCISEIISFWKLVCCSIRSLHVHIQYVFEDDTDNFNTKYIKQKFIRNLHSVDLNFIHCTRKFVKKKKRKKKKKKLY